MYTVYSIRRRPMEILINCGFLVFKDKTEGGAWTPSLL
uniref:Uncharacterized protein n=1 Tax=Anguilla anguilla TaxID=7936 RepID=A0A0E9TLT4_ANGAN